MKKHLITTTAAGAVLAMSAPAQADGYVSVFGGITMMNDDGGALWREAWPWTTGGGSYWDSWTNTTKNSISASNLTSTSQYYGFHWYGGYRGFASNTRLDIDIDNGFVIGAAAGKYLGGGLMIEGEIAYRKNDLQLGWQSSKKTYSHLYTSFGYYHNTGGFTTTTSMFTTSTTSMVPYTMGDYHDTMSHSHTYTNTGVPTTTTMTTLYTTTTGAGTGSGIQDLVYTLWSSSSVESGELTSFAIMANVWLDLCPDDAIHPYIGGGIGWADAELEVGSYSTSDSGFAWQVGVGVGFDITDSTRIDVMYRFFDIPDAEFLHEDGSDLGLDYEVSELTVGLRFMF